MHAPAKSATKVASDRRRSKRRADIAGSILRHGIALLLVAAAALIAYPFRAEIFTTPLFFVAVVISAWYGGVGPGALSVLASVVVIHYGFHRPGLVRLDQDFARLAQFVLVGGVLTAAIAARRRAERALRQAREELETKVAERTGALRRSEKELRDLIETIPAMAFLTRPDGSNEFVSRQWINYTGLSAEQSAGGGWEAMLHPEDADRHRAKWRASWNTGQPFENEARHRDSNGNYRWLLVRAVPLRDEQGNILKWYGAAIDVEDRKRAQASLADEKRILEMAAKGDSLSEILDCLCRLVEQQTEEAIASILLLDHNRLRHGGAPSLPKTYTDAIDGAEIGPGVGSCGTAAYTGQQVIVEDISTDPLWANYRDLALPHGLRACWSTPVLSSEGKVIATFAMYYREPRRPSLRDQEIIEQITHLAGIAIERKLTQEAIRVSEARYRVLVEHAPEAIVVLDFEQGRFVDVNENAVRLFGRSKEELLKIGPVQLSPVVQPDGRPSKEVALEKLRRAAEGGTPVFEWTHLNAAGQEIPSEIRLVRIPTADGILIRGSVTDITRRKRTLALLAGEKRLLEMIATGVSLKKIANALCDVIEEQRPDTLASVLLLNPDGVHLDVIAGSKLPPDWTQQMEKLPVGPCAGSCGTAAYLGERVIVADIATDPLWNLPEHRSAALRHGLRASWSSPVRSSKGKVLGTFCMYYRQARAPTDQDLELIELATHLARVAIERDRAEEALRTSEQLARSHVDVIMRSLDVLATEAAPEKFIGEMLRTIGQSLHASRVLLWLRNKVDDALHLHLMIEDGQQIPPHPDHPYVQDAYKWKKDGAFMQEMLFTKAPLVFDDVNNDSRIDPALREYFIRRGAKKFLTVPMFVAGEFSGFIGIHHAEEGAYRADEIELAQALAHHVMLAVHGQELVDQQRQAAILKERTRMARDIHDNLAQGFTGVIVQMEAADEALLDDDPENAARHIRRAGDLARESLGEARRSVHALRPQALEKAGFADALKAIIQNTTAGTSLRADFQLNGEPHELPSDVEENLLHIGQEALSNALKHAHASRFQAQLFFDSQAVRLELSDNGDGFVVDKANGGGIGLIGMKERAEQIGATLILSSKPGVGTSIVAVSPYQNLPT